MAVHRAKSMEELEVFLMVCVAICFRFHFLFSIFFSAQAQWNSQLAESSSDSKSAANEMEQRECRQTAGYRVRLDEERISEVSKAEIEKEEQDVEGTGPE